MAELHIDVQRLSKFYDQRKAIDELSFTVEKGEVLGFLGPNGAGKSTTMKILTCFMPASSGEAKVAGYDVFEQPLEVKKRVGYLPETPPVYLDMIVSDYLEYAGALHGLKGNALKHGVNVALEKCGLGQVKNRIIGNLSKGYRQRVGLGQAIVHNPSVLILDEPTSGLDPHQIHEIRELIKSFKGEHTVILSTHILPEVEAICSKVLIIKQGKIVVIDSLSAVSARLRKGNAFHFTIAGPSSDVLPKVRSLQGVVGVDVASASSAETTFTVTSHEGSDVRALVADAVIKSGAALVELKRESASLEEVFLKLTTVE